MASEFKVLVSSSEFPEVGMEVLRDKVTICMPKTNGFDPDTLEECRKECMELIKGVDAVVWCARLPFGKDFLERAGSQLKIVTSYSAGVDHFDIEELKARRIQLANTPYVLNDAVAELAILLIIGVARRMKEAVLQIQSGKWAWGPLRRVGLEIKDSVVGVIGFGGIGQTIVKKLKGFDVREFLYCGNSEKPEGKEHGAKFVSFDELLKRSDIIIVSCSLNEKTKKLINGSAFKKMKNTAILINVSRGAVIDQDALVDALKNQIIFGAGLDVMEPEPLPKDHPLVSLPNCFLTPHTGSGTINTRNEMARFAAINAILGLNGDPLLTPVYTL